MYSVKYKTYPTPLFNEKEAMRYAGCPVADDASAKLLSECYKEAEKILSYKVSWIKLPLEINGSNCSFELFDLSSEKLAANLAPCKKAVIFAATVGIELDRLISKYSKLSPAKALMFQAIGAERIEALCDTFCEDISSQLNCKTRPRFSPGYGDLALDNQKKIFSVLDCERKLGLSLNNSLLMSPTKSVSAILGLID